MDQSAAWLPPISTAVIESCGSLLPNFLLSFRAANTTHTRPWVVAVMVPTTCSPMVVGSGLNQWHYVNISSSLISVSDIISTLLGKIIKFNVYYLIKILLKNNLWRVVMMATLCIYTYIYKEKVLNFHSIQFTYLFIFSFFFLVIVSILFQVVYKLKIAVKRIRVNMNVLPRILWALNIRRPPICMWKYDVYRPPSHDHQSPSMRLCWVPA